MFTKWDRFVSLVLGAIVLAVCGIGAYRFIARRPILPLTTPEAVRDAAAWLQAFFAVVWIGYAFLTMFLLVLLSIVVAAVADTLKKRKRAAAPGAGSGKAVSRTTLAP